MLMSTRQRAATFAPFHSASAAAPALEPRTIDSSSQNVRGSILSHLAATCLAFAGARKTPFLSVSISESSIVCLPAPVATHLAATADTSHLSYILFVTRRRLPPDSSARFLPTRLHCTSLATAGKRHTRGPLHHMHTSTYAADPTQRRRGSIIGSAVAAPEDAPETRCLHLLIEATFQNTSSPLSYPSKLARIALTTRSSVGAKFSRQQHHRPTVKRGR